MTWAVWPSMPTIATQCACRIGLPLHVLAAVNVCTVQPECPLHFESGRNTVVACLSPFMFASNVCETDWETLPHLHTATSAVGAVSTNGVTHQPTLHSTAACPPVTRSATSNDVEHAACWRRQTDRRGQTQQCHSVPRTKFLDNGMPWWALPQRYTSTDSRPPATRHLLH